MTISNELMAAILSMDSYNRGYDAGIDNLGGVGASLGNWLISTDSETVLETKDRGKAASFYAVAYHYNGETIISYRGTDGLGDLGADLSIGLGNPNSAQAYLAAEFYRNVAAGMDPYWADVTFAGHSLGGGLAGLVAGEIANTKH
jgi:Protein of unknown function (DUF2974)